MENTSNKTTTYDKFVAAPVFMCKTTGIDISNPTGRRSFRMKFIFWASFVNFLIICTSGIAVMYRLFGNSSNFLQATGIAPCLFFSSMSIFKAYSTLHNAEQVMNIQRKFRAIFPQTKQDQEEFDVEGCRKRMTAIMIYYAGTCMSLVGAFDVCATFQSAVETVVYNQTFVRRLPYDTWYPFGMSNSFVYAITYLHQSCAAYTAVAITVGADVLMCSLVMQLVMHFNFLSKDLSEYGPGKNAIQDCALLGKVIQRHQLLLRICKDLNNIFSPSILFNFIVSSLVICLVGFQATTDANLWDSCKYMIFFLAAMSQIFLLCYFGNMLIDASAGVAEGAYSQNWIDANQEYKSMLLMVIMRAQNIASLKVMPFERVSLRSFNTVCSMAYQFFTLLRTFYSK